MVQHKKYTLTVLDICQETVDCRTIKFKQPNLRKIKYCAGQYLSLIFHINGRLYVRPYSFSSAPSVDSTLDITVKKVQNGIVSSYIIDKLEVGDVIEVLEPMGNFKYNISINKTIYLWGAGSGITPLFSIIKEVLNTNQNTSIHLIYSNKNQESVIFKKQISQLQKDYSSVFSVTYFYSQAEKVISNQDFYPGRITSNFVTSLLTQNSHIKESVHYICGPSDLKDDIKNILLKLEVPFSSIYTEDFKLNIDEREFDNVKYSQVTIFFEGGGTEFFVPKGKSVLEVALDNDIAIPYSCQTGNCNTCKGRLKTGQLKMLGKPKEIGCLGQNDYLLCCSYPLTDKVSIELI